MTPISRPNPRSQARSAARRAPCRRSISNIWNAPIARLLDEFHQHRLGQTVEDEQYADAEIEFFDDLVGGVHARQSEIDELLTARLAQGWTLARLDKTMLQILRCGTYELLARNDVPKATAISEYVDVAKAFFDDRERIRKRYSRCRRQRGAAIEEGGFIAALRDLATHPAARGLDDDAAVFEVGGETLVLTHDTLVQGPHQETRTRQTLPGSWSP